MTMPKDAAQADADPVAPEQDQMLPQQHARFIWTVTSIAVAALWVYPATASLWLDELVTWWVVQDDLPTAIDRAFEYQQSPLYYVAAWLAKTLGGANEFTFRVPCLLFATGAAWFLHRIVLRLVGVEAARLAVLAFVVSPFVTFSASDARPYALAMMTLTGAALALTRWLDEGRRSDGWWFALAVAATIWAHYLFAASVAALLIYAAVRIRRRDSAIGSGALVLALLGAAVLAAPLLAQVVSLWDRRSSLSIPADATFSGFAELLFVPVSVAGLVLGVLLAMLAGRLSVRVPTERRHAVALFAPWALFAPTLLFMIAALSSIDFLSARYSFSVMPAVAALLGWGLASISPSSARRIVVVVMVMLAVLANGRPLKAGEDWRGAAAFERAVADEGTIVLVHPALIESAQPGWLSDPERRSYLLAPLSFYPMDGQVVPMPYALDDDSESYLEDVVLPLAAKEEEFILVTRQSRVPFAAWLDGRLEEFGYGSRVLGSFGVVTVIEFVRTHATA